MSSTPTTTLIVDNIGPNVDVTVKVTISNSGTYEGLCIVAQTDSETNLLFKGTGANGVALPAYHGDPGPDNPALITPVTINTGGIGTLSIACSSFLKTSASYTPMLLTPGTTSSDEKNNFVYNLIAEDPDCSLRVILTWSKSS